jgi:hypothetical protein
VLPDVGAGGVTAYVPLLPPLWPSENWQEEAQAAGTDHVRVVVWPRSMVVGLADRVGLQDCTLTVPSPGFASALQFTVA